MMAATVSILALAGCNNVTRELREFRDFFNPPVNVTEYNYAVVDGLVANAHERLRLDTPIGLGVLYPMNLNPGEDTPPFGKVVVDQMGTRLIQLGYTVRDLGVPTREALRMPEATWLERGRAAGVTHMITGNYTITEYDILVAARLVRLADNKLVSSSDYRMPLGSDTYRLLGRDPFYAVPKVTHNQTVKTVPGSPLPARDLPTKIVP
jgi:hypothetical protein